MSCIWNLSTICRFCHSDGNFRSFTLPNIHQGRLESYGDVLQKTFNLHMSMPTGVNASNMICDDCISSLTDAAKFKNQVQACENKFQQYVKNEFFTLEPGVKDSFTLGIKTEIDDEENLKNTQIDVPHIDSSEVKIEKSLNLECKEDSCFEDINFDENYTLDETNDKPYLKEDHKNQEKNNVTENGLKNVKPKNLKSKKIGRNKYTVPNKTEKIIRIKLTDCLKTHKKTYNCQFCKQKFYKPSYLSKHILQKHGKLHMCNFCKETCNTQAQLYAHLEKHMRQKVFECDICHGKFSCRTAVIKHLRTHDPERKDKIHECPQCSWKFANRTNLNNHIQVVHEHIRKYHCTGCMKQFASKKSLDRHFRTHTNERPFECEICQRKYRDLSTVQKHKRRIHQYGDIKKVTTKCSYRCNICHLKFDHRGLYRDHLLTHPETNFVCEQCGIVLTSDKSLKNHIRTHNPARFICDSCDSTYKSKLQLKRHIKKIHLKTFKKSECDICGKFVVDLKQHQAIHKEKHFTCPLCQKTFSERNRLRRHLKDFHGGYSCCFCGKKYTSKKRLMNHNLKCTEFSSGKPTLKRRLKKEVA